MNTDKMNGKKIYAVWWPDTESEKGVNLKSGKNIQLEMSATYHGDHEEFWIVHKNADGKEISRHNPRYVETIIWDRNEP